LGLRCAGLWLESERLEVPRVVVWINFFTNVVASGAIDIGAFFGFEFGEFLGAVEAPVVGRPEGVGVAGWS